MSRCTPSPAPLLSPIPPCKSCSESSSTTAIIEHVRGDMDVPGLCSPHCIAALRDSSTLCSLDEAINGQARVPCYTVNGGPGCGKSRLLSELPRLCVEAASDDADFQRLLSECFYFSCQF